MQVHKIIFSPTGGTRRAADYLSESWGAPAQVIDLCDTGADFSSYSMGEGDAALIAVPSFGGRVPAPAAERLARVKGNGAKCVLLCVYGNRAYEDTLIELFDLAQQGGFRPVAAVAAVAEHSIVREIAAGRPDAQDKEELQGFSKEILARINDDRYAGPLSVPGSRPYRKSGGGGLVPKADSRCVRCGLCARQCPVGAISPEDPGVTDKAACISCMRCIAVCPHHARALDDATLAAVTTALKKACSQRKANELFL